MLDYDHLDNAQTGAMYAMLAYIRSEGMEQAERTYPPDR